MVQKVVQRLAGKNRQYAPKDVSTGAADSGHLVALNSAGKIDDTMLPPSVGDGSRTGVASEALTAGAFVNEYSNAGTWTVRLADNGNSRPATGFVKVAVSNAAQATVFPMDSSNAALTGLTPGAEYYLGTAGGTLATPLDATAAGNVGKIDQKLGVARSATELLTDDYDYVIL